MDEKSWLLTVASGGIYKPQFFFFIYCISSYKSPGSQLFFIPSIFDPACKQIGPFLETRHVFSIGLTNVKSSIEFRTGLL